MALRSLSRLYRRFLGLFLTFLDHHVLGAAEECLARSHRRRTASIEKNYAMPDDRGRDLAAGVIVGTWLVVLLGVLVTVLVMR